MKYGYKEVRKIGMDDLRRLCIRNDWYTNGTNEDYDNLLNMTNVESLSSDDIVEMATDIVEHSKDSLLEDISSVMTEIANSCYYYFEQI